MDIFGIGGTELLAIFIIMLVVAGPKRMIQWAYVLGQYTAKARKMWAEIMGQVQKELNQAGVDIELPKEPPNPKSLGRTLVASATKAAAPLTKPIQDVIDETKGEVNAIKQGASVTTSIATVSKPTGTSNGKTAPASEEAPAAGGIDLGSWSGSSADSSGS